MCRGRAGREVMRLGLYVGRLANGWRVWDVD